ncbi:hypothetical protein DFJ73DRAFT_804704 [Zopfochytrium polystomum]|nr:hypothetical protein DFJ73DRAFT_804704 [Zopfochytrium polystomum]
MVSVAVSAAISLLPVAISVDVAVPLPVPLSVPLTVPFSVLFAASGSPAAAAAAATAGAGDVLATPQLFPGRARRSVRAGSREAVSPPAEDRDVPGLARVHDHPAGVAGLQIARLAERAQRRSSSEKKKAASPPSSIVTVFVVKPGTFQSFKAAAVVESSVAAVAHFWVAQWKDDLSPWRQQLHRLCLVVAAVKGQNDASKHGDGQSGKQISKGFENRSNGADDDAAAALGVAAAAAAASILEKPVADTPPRFLVLVVATPAILLPTPSVLAAMSSSSTGSTGDTSSAVTAPAMAVFRRSRVDLLHDT